MPATDGLAPPMSEGARDAVKDSGGWTHTVESYGGKAHDQDDIEETRQIAENDRQYEGGTKGGNK